jgi:peptide/nickel transport system substrate-binding protein
MYIIRKKRPNKGEHPYIPELKHLYQQKRITRREFLRNATALGLSIAGANLFLASCGGGGEDATATSPPQPTSPPEAQPTATAVPTAVPTAAPAGPTRGGELIYAHQVQDLSDPHASQWIQFDIQMNVAEYLIDYNQQGEYVPRLVEKWEVSDDVKTWTFYVRQGIKFNHGPDLTADDVIWNFNRWLDPEVGCPLTATLVKYMTENDIEKVDDYTVRVHCDQPYAGLVAQISGGTFASHILPKDWEGDWIKQPYGTGPFTLEDYALDERAVLKRREGYWRNGADGQPLPYLDGIRYVYLGEDMATQVAALKTGEVHMIMINAQSVDMVEGTDIVVNSRPSAFAYVYKMRSDEQGAFNDNRLRQAVMACQDRQQILDAVWKGFGTIGQDHHVAPVHNVYCPVETPPRDIEKAKALLAEAGHPDGWTTTLFVPDSPMYRNYAELLKDQAEPAGLNIEIEVQPASLYWDQWTEQDFGVVPWAHRPTPEVILETMYRCDAAWNDSHWCDEEFEELLTQAGATVDVEERKAIMCEIEKIQQTRGPCALPVFGHQLRAHTPRLQDFETHYQTHTYLVETWLEEEA